MVIGFDGAVWAAEGHADGSNVGVTLRHVSPDGDEDYPGTTNVTVTSTLNDAGTLRMDFIAHTDEPTVVNLANRVYWNLAGKGDLPNRIAEIDASSYLEIGDGTLPTGTIRSVANTLFDFRQPRRIGDRISNPTNRLSSVAAATTVS